MNSAPSGVAIFYDDAGSPGTPVDITAEVLTINEISVEEITEEVHPFGTFFEDNKGIGVGRVPDLVFGGLYSETIDAMFANRIPEGPNAVTRTLTVQFIPGSPGKTFSVETILGMYKRSLDRAALGKYEVTLKHSGGAAPVET